ncbi:MAG TPA: ABC transporter permease [Gemmatimonadaceae bacterium]|nr:ABC transporter permease [Gemmatimonadaceae bacterium]
MSLIHRLRRASFWPMLRKEFIQMRRDRFTLAMLIGIPAIQLALFGYAVQTEVRNVPTVVLDQSHTPQSRRLVDMMANTRNFRIIRNATNREDVRNAIERGEAAAAIIVPPEFATDLKRGHTAQAQVIVDAADPLSSAAAISAAALTGARSGPELTGRSTPVVAPVVDVRVRPWYNPESRSSHYIVPGIIGILLTMTMVSITGAAIVRERERGTLEQLVVTPIGKTSLMLGKTIPFALVGYLQVTVILVLGKLLFDIPLRGNLLLLYLLIAPFVVASLGTGLFISAVTKTQVQAMQLSFFFIMPNILLSGFMFPRAAMPEPAQWVGAALPLTYFLTVMRGVLLKGVAMNDIWRDAVILTGFAVVLVAMSVRKFSKTVE